MVSAANQHVYEKAVGRGGEGRTRSTPNSKMESRGTEAGIGSGTGGRPSVAPDLREERLDERRVACVE
jgi:hypothetical protein